MDDPLEEVVTFGKYKGATWKQVLNRDPRYAQWASANVKHLDTEIVEAIELYIEESPIEDEPYDFPEYDRD